jgi:hypothetical protein
MTGSGSERGHGDGPDQPAVGQSLTEFTKTVNMLFDLRSRRDGRKYTPTQWARLIRKETGVKVSHTWLARLFSGDITNPGKDSLELLARFHGVSPAVFFGQQAAQGTDAQWKLFAEMADSGVQSIAMLSYGVDDETREAVRVILRNARKAQGLDDVSESEPKPASPPELEG